MSALKSVQLYNADGKCCLDDVEIAGTFFRRLKGLLGRKKIEKGHGLLLEPCASIHMFFMRFAIDVFFLKEKNGSYELLSVARSLKPWRMAFAPEGTTSVLETAPGAVVEAQPGDIFAIKAV